MNRFEKVNFEQYKTDSGMGTKEYDGIKLPKRATVCSAGYDFFLPHDIVVPFGESVTVATGIRAVLDDDNVLMIYPRSGLGFKRGITLANTVGVIDADYAKSDNEGHIFVKLINNSPLTDSGDVALKAGTAFCQGIIIRYAKTCDDATTKQRNGGFGSTDA